MPEISYQMGAVAFIDVLGFKEVVRSSIQSEGHKRCLEDLIEALESAVPSLDARVSPHVPLRLYPKHTYISDCIVLSAPLLDCEYPLYSGLEVVVMRCIQLTHKFLDLGYLLRGGISAGFVWHSDGNIVGPAYQEAYRLETQTKQPRIALSKEAIDYWGKPFNEGSRMCLKRQGVVMVNGVHDYYMPDNSTYEGIQKEFSKYEKIVESKLSSNELDEDVKKKWEWFKNYLVAERNR